MNQDQLQHLEETFNIALPDDYKAFMLAYPTTLSSTQLLIGNSPQTPSQWEFLGSVERLLEVNRFVREEPGIEWLEDGGAWPEQKFVIGEDIGGDYFAIDLAGTGEVWQYEHEDGVFQVLEPTLHLYAERVLRDYAAYNQRKSS